MVVLIGVVASPPSATASAVQALERGRRAEAESFARILQGLSRSVSPTTSSTRSSRTSASGPAPTTSSWSAADPTRVLEATLVNARTGGPLVVDPLPDLRSRRPVRRRPSSTTGASRSRSRSRSGPAPALVATARASQAAGRRRPMTCAASANAAATTAPIRSDPSSPAGRTRRRARGSGSRSRGVAPVALRGQADLVAERIAARARRVYGLAHAGGPADRRRRRDRSDHRLPPDRRCVAGGRAADPGRCRRRGVRRPVAGVLAPPGGGARRDGRPDRSPNRRYFDEICALLARRRRAEDAIGILMVDIDRFKDLNDATAMGRRRGPPRRRRRDRRRRSRGRRAGTVRWRGVRGAAPEPDRDEACRGR